MTDKSKKADEEEEDDENEEEEELDEGDDSGDATDKKKSGSSKPEGRVYTQEQVDAAIARRLAREKRKLKGEIRGEIEDEIRTSGKDDDLQKQLDTALAKVKTLEELEELADIAEERYEQELEDLPEHIRDLAPDDDASILTKERWLVQKGRPAAAKYLAEQKKGEKKDDEKDDKSESKDEKKKTAKRGLNPKDPPADTEDKRTSVEKLRDEAQRSGLYRRIA